MDEIDYKDPIFECANNANQSWNCVKIFRAAYRKLPAGLRTLHRPLVRRDLGWTVVFAMASVFIGILLTL